jgi:hypothetical protein
VWNALVTLRPFTGFVQCFFTSSRERLVVHRGVGYGTSDGIEQALEQADGLRNLIRRQLVNKLMRVLFVCRHAAILHVLTMPADVGAPCFRALCGRPRP